MFWCCHYNWYSRDCWRNAIFRENSVWDENVRMLFYLLMALADGHFTNIAHALHVALGDTETTQLDNEVDYARRDGVWSVFGHKLHAINLDADKMAQS